MDTAANRLNGFTYDNNGNQLVTASTLYDVFNRMKTADGSTHYAYAADNKRVLKLVGGTVELTHYGITGQRMSTYALQPCGVGTCMVAVMQCGDSDQQIGGVAITRPAIFISASILAASKPISFVNGSTGRMASNNERDSLR